MPDVRWPKEWVEYRGPKGGFGYRFLAPRGYTSMRLTEMSVLVPVDEHGEPDIDGLLARLRFDPNHALPVAVGADCRTTHYACRCVMERLERAEAEAERLRVALQSVLSIDDDYPLDPSGYDPDEYQRLRGIIDAARAALAEWRRVRGLPESQGSGDGEGA